MHCFCLAGRQVVAPREAEDPQRAADLGSQILAGLEHPAIARLLDGGFAEDGTPFFVMERVDGQRIDRWCDTRGLGIPGRLELLCLDDQLLLGDPQLTYPSVHVTGTNGKGSVVRMVGALCSAAGLSAGTYTSPHLQSVRERLAVAGRSISPARFAEVHDEVAPLADLIDTRLSERDGPEADHVTYFELLTAMAYSWFADAPVDVGVFEVGMGGVWDATNLVRGDVAVINEIDVEVSYGETNGEPVVTFTIESHQDDPTTVQETTVVFRDEEGEIIGFLGVLPRPMTLEGRPIWVAIGNNFMVVPTSRMRMGLP